MDCIYCGKEIDEDSKDAEFTVSDDKGDLAGYAHKVCYDKACEETYKEIEDDFKAGKIDWHVANGKIERRQRMSDNLTEKEIEEAKYIAKIASEYGEHSYISLVNELKRIRSEAMQAKEQEIAEDLKNPEMVYVNFLRGSIDASAIIKAEVVHKIAEAVQAEREKRYCIEQDGDQWLATAPGFIDLQNSSYIAAAYGKSPVEAINNLLSRRKEFPKLTWEETEKIYDIVDRIRDERTLAMGSEEFELSSHEAMGLLSTAMIAFSSYQSPGKDIIRKAAVLLECVPCDSDFGKACHEVAAILSDDKESTNG